jgi:hypothetical protein
MRNLDLIDWTMQEARQLNPDHHIASEPNGSASLTKLLEAFESDQIKPTADETIVQFTVAPSIEPGGDSSSPRASPELTVNPKPNTASDFLAPTQAAPSSAISAGAGPKRALLKAIVEPDIYTAPTDRDRAIDLRWMLRDIKSNRLKWSPINQHDLRKLVGMGLVEIRNDAPVLTNVGVNAII